MTSGNFEFTQKNKWDVVSLMIFCLQLFGQKIKETSSVLIWKRNLLLTWSWWYFSVVRTARKRRRGSREDKSLLSTRACCYRWSLLSQSLMRDFVFFLLLLLDFLDFPVSLKETNKNNIRELKLIKLTANLGGSSSSVFHIFFMSSLGGSFFFLDW